MSLAGHSAALGVSSSGHAHTIFEERVVAGGGCDDDENDREQLADHEWMGSSQEPSHASHLTDIEKAPAVGECDAWVSRAAKGQRVPHENIRSYAGGCRSGR